MLSLRVNNRKEGAERNAIAVWEEATTQLSNKKLATAGADLTLRTATADQKQLTTDLAASNASLTATEQKLEGTRTKARAETERHQALEKSNVLKRAEFQKQQKSEAEVVKAIRINETAINETAYQQKMAEIEHAQQTFALDNQRGVVATVQREYDAINSELIELSQAQTVANSQYDQFRQNNLQHLPDLIHR